MPQVILQPYNQSETFITLIRNATTKFFSSTPVKITNYFINLVTLEGLSTYYKNLESENNIIEKPYLITSLNDTPRILDEIANVNLNTLRIFPSISLRTNKVYYKQDEKFATRMLTTENMFLSRIDQYMTANINHKIMCESYEMAYDLMRYSQSFFLQDKIITFRNIITAFMLKIDDITQLPEDIIQQITDNCLYVITSADNKTVLCLPANAWLQVKVTDHTIETEGIPYEGSRINYTLSLTWQINYSEPASYVLVY